jgi:hypothetical protein
MTINIELAEEDLDFIIETMTNESDFNADCGDMEGDEDEVDMACRAVEGRRIVGYLQTLMALANSRVRPLFSDN